MIVAVKVLIGLAVVAGVSAAIGVPVGMHFKKTEGEGLSQVSSSEESSSSGGGIHQTSVPIERMSKCDASNNPQIETIVFGSQHDGSVCWILEPKDSSNTVIGEEQKYSELFKAMWTNKKGNWGSGSNYWKTNCTTGKKWTFTNSVGGSEYLGPCDNSEYPQKWVVVTNKNRGNIKIEVCQGECFESTIDSYGWKRLVRTQRKDGWFEVRFQKNHLEKVTRN